MHKVSGRLHFAAIFTAGTIFGAAAIGSFPVLASVLAHLTDLGNETIGLQTLVPRTIICTNKGKIIANSSVRVREVVWHGDGKKADAIRIQCY